jgi:hemolysin activation/secretion protein
VGAALLPRCQGAAGPQTALLARGLCLLLGALLLVPAAATSVAEPAKRGSIAPSAERQFEAKANEGKRRRAQFKLPELESGQSATGKQPLFVLQSVTVVGATAFGSDTFVQSYRAHLGRRVSEQDLSHIVQRITERYRQDGYSLSRAVLLPQDIQNGHVRITVLEGRVEDIAIKGDQAGRFGVQRLLEPIRAQHPLKLATLERQLLILSDTPGIRIVDVNIEEVKPATGRFKLLVQVETWHVWTAFDLDNHGSREIGPLQAFIGTAFNSFGTGGETVAINLATVPDAPRELRFGGIVLDVPVATGGGRVAAIASYSDISPDDARRAVDGRIRTDHYALSGTIAPLRTQESSLWLTGIVGMRNVDETSSAETVYRDRVRYVGLAAAYQRNDRDASNYLAIGLRQGLDILGASDEGDLLLSRADASAEFTKAYLTFTRLHRFSDRWSLLFTGAAQAASGPLFGSEAFYLGGPFSGRAFRGDDVSGDAGLSGLAELRYDQSLEGRSLKGYQLYVFVDGGAVWDHGTGFSDRATLSSLGAGLRFALKDNLTAGVEVAVPIGDYSASSSDGGPRLFFTISQSFKGCTDRLQFCSR